MIIKFRDYRKLMRGYDIDQQELDRLLKTFYSKNRILRKYREKQEQTGKDYNLSDCYKETQDAYLDFHKYNEGKLLTEIVKDYEKSGKTFLELTNICVQAQRNIPLPPMVEGMDDVMDFPNCCDEEEIFNFEKERIIREMEKLLPRPVKKASTKGISDLLVNIDKGYWGLSTGGLTLKAGETVAIGLGRQGSDSIVRTIQLSPKSLENGIPELNLTPYDSAILSVIAQLKLEGNDFINVATIARALKGNKEGHISEKTKQEILSSIMKMMCLITIDYTDEATHYKFGEDTKSFYYGMLLPVELNVTVNLNGNIIHDGIRILRVPILFELALRKAQVTSLPLSALAVRGYMTKKVITLSSYLMQRVGAMKPTKQLKTIKGKEVEVEKHKSITIRTIRVDSLLKSTIPDKRKDRDEKSIQLQKAEAILQQYKEDGIIYGFCFNYREEQDEKKQKYIIAMNKKQEREMWEKL